MNTSSNTVRISRCKIKTMRSLTNVNNVALHLFRPANWTDIRIYTLVKSRINATNVILQLFGQTVWKGIWSFTREKNHMNATNANMHLFRQVIWEDTWNLTLWKKHTSAINATLRLFGQTNWEHIWKLTLGRNHTNAINATLHLSRQAISGNIWKLTQEKSHSNAISVTLQLFKQALWLAIWKLTLEKDLKKTTKTKYVRIKLLRKRICKNNSIFDIILLCSRRASILAVTPMNLFSVHQQQKNTGLEKTKDLQLFPRWPRNFWALWKNPGEFIFFLWTGVKVYFLKWYRAMTDF